MSLYVWGDVSMRKTMRDRNRWFTAVAMTCLSGFALCGCTSGSRDLSSKLTESAGREAIEAERHVAERKKQETGRLKSKELLASKDRPASPKRDLPASDTSDEFRENDLESAEFSSRSTVKKKRGQAQLVDGDLANADWATDSPDRRVQTVSSDEEADIESAWPLLDNPRTPPAAADLFDEDEATVKVPKSSSRSEKTQQRPGRASFDGTSEHPWSQKAPTVARSTMTSPSVAQQPTADIESPESTTDWAPPAASTPKLSSTRVKPAQPDEAQQGEAKARVQTLLTQSKSLLNRGEYRSAFRVAQLAQRIADSENLFFAAGEEQPADIVRSVSMKIRSEEKQIVSTQGETSRTAQPASRTTGVGIGPDAPFENPGIIEGKTVSAESNNSPWAVTKKKSPVQPVMRISPGSASRGSRFNDPFPKSRTEWQSSTNEPQTLTSPEQEFPPGIARAKDGRLESNKIVHAKLGVLPKADGLSDETTGFSNHEHVPLPFPAKAPNRQSAPSLEERESSSSEPLAVAQDWRTQNLNDVATSRQPLLVAPLPPAEPLIPSALTDTADDIFAVEIDETSTPPPGSKLWMILAAGAGAFAMLFVRRRPIPVVRASRDAQ